MRCVFFGIFVFLPQLSLGFDNLPLVTLQLIHCHRFALRRMGPTRNVQSTPPLYGPRTGEQDSVARPRSSSSRPQELKRRRRRQLRSVLHDGGGPGGPQRRRLDPRQEGEALSPASSLPSAREERCRCCCRLCCPVAAACATAAAAACICLSAAADGAACLCVAAAAVSILLLLSCYWRSHGGLIDC